MSSIMISIRFLLELVTVMGLLGGLLTEKTWAVKLSFAFIGLLMVLVWSRYGAPKSSQALTGLSKLGLEVLAFGLGSVGAFVLYGKHIGWCYTLIALGDLLGIYLLGLN
ncbi:DUF2568 domain-containing protein [Streptococcus dentasini]